MGDVQHVTCQLLDTLSEKISSVKKAGSIFKNLFGKKRKIVWYKEDRKYMLNVPYGLYII